MQDYWEHHKLSGDNVRERPYTALHNRVCVRSNWFETHYWVQTIDKDPTSAQDTFDPALDSISGSSRGSFKIERQVENPDQIPHYQTGGNPDRQRSLSSFHKAVVVSREVFRPQASDFDIVSIEIVEDSAVLIRWHSTPEQSYVVQRTTDGGTWIDVSSPIRATGVACSWIDDSKTSAGVSLYRVAALP
jgi:hypothetical protein